MGAVAAAQALFRTIFDPAARASLNLRLRVERLHSRMDPEELAAYPDQFKGDGLPAPTLGDTDAGAERPPSTLLESLGISGGGTRDGVFLSGFSEQYDRDVEELTAEFRVARALAHMDAAKAALRDAKTDLTVGGRPWAEVRHDLEARLRWHKGRAKGALRRFATVEDCGEARVLTLCSSCGVSHDLPSRCSVGRLCPSCRASQRAERIERLDAAQLRVVAGARRAGLTQKQRFGGAWSEKFLTLTAPHWSTGDADETIKARVEVIMRAWSIFRRQLRAWADAQEEHVPRRMRGYLAFYRGFEWTPGADAMGHPHFHLWVFGPFLPKADVAAWWTAALIRAGMPASEVPRTNVPQHRADGACSGGTCEATPDDGTRCARNLRHGLTRAERAARELLDDAAHVVEHVQNRASRVQRARCLRVSSERKRRHAAALAVCALGPCSAYGVPMDAVRIDIRAARSRGLAAEVAKGALRVAGSDIVRYVEGWSLVDVTADGERIAARTMARLFEVLDRRRLTATSRGLLAAPEEGCGSCGQTRTVHVEIFDPRLEQRRTTHPATGPPSRAPSSNGSR